MIYEKIAIFSVMLGISVSQRGGDIDIDYVINKTNELLKELDLPEMKQKEIDELYDFHEELSELTYKMALK